MGEERLNTCCRAVHRKGDGACRRHDGDLGIAVAELFASLFRGFPACFQGLREVGKTFVAQQRVIDDGELILDTLRRVLPGTGGPAVVADDAEHVLAVFIKVDERSHLLGHKRGSRVTLTR